MQIVGITQRVQENPTYPERRDALDQKWTEFLLVCNITPIILPNHAIAVVNLIERISLKNFILTGGNSLMKLGGDAPERDALEKNILEISLKNQYSVLGVCRGMQVIQDYFHTPLKKVENHVCPKQTILLEDHEIEVNSYHDYGTDRETENMKSFAKAKDGIIKGIRHLNKPIMGIMWHPERLEPFQQRDIDLFKNFFAVS